MPSLAKPPLPRPLKAKRSTSGLNQFYIGNDVHGMPEAAKQHQHLRAETWHKAPMASVCSSKSSNSLARSAKPTFRNFRGLGRALGLRTQADRWKQRVLRLAYRHITVLTYTNPDFCGSYCQSITNEPTSARLLYKVSRCHLLHSTYLSIYLFIYLSICCPSICPSVYLSIHLLSIYLPICLSIYLPAYLSDRSICTCMYL